MFMKKILSAMIMCMLLFGGIAVYQQLSEPTIVAEAAGLGNFDVSMNSDGTIKITDTNIGQMKSQEDVWNKIMGTFRTVVMAISGIGTICMVLFFILNFIKLGAASTNASEVAKIKTGMLYSGLAAAGLGSVTLIVGLFYGMLK